MPRPSSLTRSVTLFRSRVARQQDPALGRLPGRDARVRRLDAVVGRVPDQVQQRVADLVENRAVELDLLAFDVEADALAEVAREVAHQPRKALEHLAHRRHPRRDHLGLHPRHQPRDPVAHLGERRIVGAGGQDAQPVLRDDQLADLLHQAIEPARGRRGSGGGAPRRRPRRPTAGSSNRTRLTSPARPDRRGRAPRRWRATRSGSASRPSNSSRSSWTSGGRTADTTPSASARRSARIARAPRITASGRITTWTDRPRGASVARRRGGPVSTEGVELGVGRAPLPPVAASSAAPSITSAIASRPAAAGLDAAGRARRPRGTAAGRCPRRP